MYAVQQPLSMSGSDDVMGTPAWNLPSCSGRRNDEVIPPMPEAVREADGRRHDRIEERHVAMVSHLRTYELIVTAANGGRFG